MKYPLTAFQFKCVSIEISYIEYKKCNVYAWYSGDAIRMGE